MACSGTVESCGFALSLGAMTATFSTTDRRDFRSSVTSVLQVPVDRCRPVGGRHNQPIIPVTLDGQYSDLVGHGRHFTRKPMAAAPFLLVPWYSLYSGRTRARGRKTFSSGDREQAEVKVAAY